MNNKLAIALCVHHKPWLIMSTLITLAMQDYVNFDMYVLYQMGDGSCPDKRSYKPYFKLAKKYGYNVQLSPYDDRVREVINKVNFKNCYEMEFENDHGLDSGCWYKFIKTKKWEKYDYCFFIQEGTLFTGPTVLSSALEFVKSNDIHFLTSGHEKRRLPKKVFLNCNTRGTNNKEFDLYHDQRIREIFDIFSRDKNIKKLFDQWGSDFPITTQNHVPYVGDSIFNSWYQTLRTIKHCREFPFANKVIYENTLKRSLKNVINNFTEYKNVIFHKANDVEWFGCSCQHLLSNNLLKQFYNKLKKNNIFEVLDIPFSGTALEVIWGFIPVWLGFDKWFFNGIHRVRKNFITNKREDDPIGMCGYINKYFRGKIKVVPDGDYIKIKKIKKEYLYIKNILGS